jgi:hypothetical protein
MGKDLDIGSYPWMQDVGLAADQFAHVWTYAGGEDVPSTDEYRNLTTGEAVNLKAGEAFPAGRYARSIDIPAPRFKEGTDWEEVTS